MYKRYIGFIFLLIIASAFVRCASVGAPQGGPKDSLPPTFLYSNPQPYATNFKGGKATLTFNEYVQLKDQSKLFFMSPPAQKKPILSIKGKSVEIEFQEPLDSNATYRIDFGASIVDNNEGNRMDNFSIVFSTGNVIDSLIMAGQVIDALSRDTIIGSFVFFFDPKADSAKLDSTMFKSRADALFRSDSSGYFIADILKDKDYRVYAIQDENSNQLYEAGVDKIAFIDTVFNPTNLAPFDLQYNERTRRWEIDSLQAVFEVFKEEPPKKQTLLETKRPLRQKITIAFNSQNTIIDSLKFDSIPDNWIIKSWNPTKDTITLWIAPDTEKEFKALPDTIKARIAFQKQDSVWNFYSHGQDLSFNHKIYVDKKVSKKLEEKKINKIKKRKIRHGKKTSIDTLTNVLDSLPTVVLPDKEQKKDSVKVENPFKINVKAAKEFIPLQDMIFDFEFPLNSVNFEQITLRNFPKTLKKGKLVSEENQTGAEVKFTFSKDSINDLRYVLKADWKEDIDYELVIPEGALNNIAFQTNDTLSSKFTVMPRSKFGTLSMKTYADSSYNGCYILQLTQKSDKEDKVIRQFYVKNITQTIKFEYLNVGKYRLKVIRDQNCNQKWDTGDLVNRRKPEMVRLYVDKFGSNQILSKENWELTVDLDYKKMFAK